MRQGGLFEGYGGLSMAVAEVLGADLAWYSEHEPATKSNPKPTQAAARLLAYRHPGVPNLGDITAIDWASAPPVDVLTGGFPCQDVSLAGQRRGIRPDSRSGLWTHMAYAIDQLRPRLVVIENVRGLLSADAACDLEPCPWCLGDDEGRPLRALGAVLGDLAELGYDARWCGLRAADVGAPHGRFRVFVVARPAADAHGPGLEVRGGFPRPRARVTAQRGGRSAPSWGEYEPAIRRWELILGRPAPAPTQTGRGGGQQLSPRFVEWLMGLPEGHVTAVPGLTHKEQLGRLGNGVVPQQAAAALRHLLDVS